MNINKDQFIVIQKNVGGAFIYNSHVVVGAKLSIKYNLSLEDCVTLANEVQYKNPGYVYEVGRIENNIVTHIFTASEAKRFLKLSKL